MKLKKQKRERNKEKQVWCDALFKNKLERLKARSLIERNEKLKLAAITRKIVEHPLFDDIERSIVLGDKKLNNAIKIKMDKKKL